MIMAILVSAGHTNKAGQDRGMQGNGYIEGVEATKLRDDVAAKLRSLGCAVIEDGSDGVNDPLKRAIALARTANIAVEFHFNAGPSTATGIEVLAKPKHKKLAQSIAKSIADATGLKLRGEQGWKSDSSGQHHRLGFCIAGGLIVEVCFMSSKSDMTAYADHYHELVLNLANALTGTVLEKRTVEPFAWPTLKRGSKGKLVVLVQEKLDIKADGDFGINTENALVKFQRANGLEVDGKVGPHTRKALGL